MSSLPALVLLCLLLLSLGLTAQVRSPLGSIWDPITQSLVPATEGLVQTSLGALEGILGTEQSFDYVVIGGGTSGNTIAYRLAEAGFSVAVIERGLSYELGKPVVGAAPVGDIIGVGSNTLDSIPTVDYGFRTTPQPGAADREIHYAQGKALGGSSALNFMIHHRPNRGALDLWAEAVGDNSYTFDNMLPYFKKPFTFTPPNTNTRLANATTSYIATDFAVSAEGGPIQVTYSNWTPAWSTWAAKGFEAIGINMTDKFNEGSLLGWFYAQLTVEPKDQVRSTSAEYIYAARDGKLEDYLTVFLDTRADNIVFNDSKTAYGVQVTAEDLLSYTIQAKKEVILSAGALHSPQLLMLSGIGPADVLNQFDIEVLADRPGIGQNLTDHVLFGPAYEVTFDTLDRLFDDPDVLVEKIAEYALNATGPLTTNVAEFLAWERMPASANISTATRAILDSYPNDWPHIEYFPAAGYIGDFNIPWADQPKNGKQYVSILGALAAPQSRGSVSITSASAADLPIFNPNWLTHEADVEVAIAIYRRLRDIFATDPIRSIRADPSPATGEYWPGADIETDEEILANIRTSVMAVMHASCTNRMGKAEEETAVVDNHFRVIGVSGLRVVDASVLPFLTPGHPQALIYALAEKLADDIIKINL